MATSPCFRFVFGLFLAISPALLFSQQLHNCGTDEHLRYVGMHPDQIGWIDPPPNGSASRSMPPYTCGILPTVPVVVHVIHKGEAIGVGSNISDAQIIDAIRGLDERYRNIIGTSSLDMEFGFALAKTDPMGVPTNGITRIDGSILAGYAASGLSFSGSAGAAEADIAALAGQNWPHADYYNIWVVWTINGAAAAYAYFPGASNFTNDGTYIGANSVTYGSSTLAHECGHAFSLDHTFSGDNNGASCPTETNCATQNDRCCDTPPHKRGDCGAVNPCSGTGVFTNSTENYMSYCGGTSRFTPDQKVRVTNALNNTARKTLIESTGLIPTGGVRELSLRGLVFPKTVLCDPTFKPVIKMKNYAAVAVTTISYKVEIDGGAAVSFNNVAVNIPAGATVDVELSLLGPVSGGSHDIRFELTNINGGGLDVYVFDNEICSSFQRVDAVSTFCENFESPTLPASFVYNLPGQVKIGTLPSNNCPTQQNRCLQITGQALGDEKEFEFTLGPLDLSGISGTPYLSFDIARAFPNNCYMWAGLKIYASDDCGKNYTLIDYKNDSQIAGCTLTEGPTPITLESTYGYNSAVGLIPDGCQDWRKEVLNLSAFAGKTVTFLFHVYFETDEVPDNIIYIDNCCINSCQAANDFNITPPLPDTIYMCDGGGSSMQSMNIPSGPNDAGYIWKASSTSINGPFNDASYLQTYDIKTSNYPIGTHYFRGITMKKGCDDTTTMILIVKSDFTVPTQPANQLGCLGQPLNLMSSFTGGTPNYSTQWVSAPAAAGPFNPIPGETDLTCAALQNVGQTFYRLVLTPTDPGCEAVQSGTANIRYDPGITITQQPDTLIECVGGLDQISITATGGGVLKYQWQRSTTGPTGPFNNFSTLQTIVPASGAAVTNYYLCILNSTNNLCKDTSVIVPGIVVSDPVLTSQPQNFQGCGGSVSLSSTASGGFPPLLYQWEKSDFAGGPYTDVVGATTNPWSPPSTAGTFYYRAKITSSGSGCAQLTSNPAEVTLDDGVAVSTEPLNITECAGGTQAFSFQFTPAASGPFIQWQSAPTATGPWSPTGTGQQTLTPPSFFAGKTFFRAILTAASGLCGDTTAVVSATIIDPPTITQQPTAVTGCGVASQNLSVTASSGGVLNYQWQKASAASGPFSPVSGATGAIFTPTATAGQTFYNVVISAAGCPNATSTAVSVAIDPDISISAQPQNLSQCVGGTLPFSITATNATTFQWQQSNAAAGTFINTGSNVATFIPQTTAPATAYFLCILSSQNGYCKDSSVVVTGIVAADPSIGAQPTGYSGCGGSGPSSVALTITAQNGIAPLSYQWQTSSSQTGPFSNIPTATASTFSAPNAPGSVWYQCVVTSTAAGCGSVTSTPANVDFSAGVQVGTEPQATSQCVGGTTALTVAATQGTPSVNWQSGPSSNGPWTNVPSGTSLSIIPNTAAAGTTFYRAILSGGGGNCRDTSVAVASTIVASPSISAQPIGYTGCGAPANFSLNTTASGAGPFTYSWQKATAASGPFSAISGATASTYMPPTAAGSSFYQCIVSAGSGCSTTSTAVLVSIEAPISFATNPSAITECQGGTTAFSTTLSGAPTGATYQWQSAANAAGPWTNVGAANQAAFTPPSISAATTFYRAILTSSGGLCKDTTTAVSALVAADQTISTQPQNFSGCAGSSAALTVAAAGGIAPLSYQWQSGPNAGGPFSNISGATMASFQPLAQVGTTFYQCVVSSAGSGCSNATSTAANVTIDDILSIQTEPTGFGECLGGTAQISASALGGPGLTYQWQAGASQFGPFSNLPGATTSAFTPPSIAAGSAFFRLVIASPSGQCKDTSTVVVCQVFNDISISNSTANYTGCVGDAISVSGSATGGAPPLGYQWQSASAAAGPFSNLAGATTTSFSINTTAPSALFYQLVVSSAGSGCGSATTTAAQITVSAGVAVVSQPQNISTCVGGATALTVTVSGTNSPTFQWQSSTNGTAWGNVPGATAASFVPPTTQNGSNLKYRCIVNDPAQPCGKDTSSVASVAVSTNFLVKTDVEVCNFNDGTNATTINFKNQITAGDPNATWVSLDIPTPPGAWTLKDFTGIAAGSYRFVATMTNAVAPCQNISDTILVKVKTCCPTVCTNAPMASLCNAGTSQFNLNGLICPNSMTGGTWTLLSGPGLPGPQLVAGGQLSGNGLQTGNFTVIYAIPTAPAGCSATSSETLLVVASPNAGTAAVTAFSFCEGLDSTINLASILVGEDPGGQWKTSGNLPVSPTNGTIQTKNAAKGQFTVRYIVVGTGCPSDTSTFTISVNETPKAVAGTDAALTCGTPTAELGSSQNGGAGLTVKWSSPTGAGIADPTDPKFSTGEPGIYFLEIKNAATGCAARDTVVISTLGQVIEDLADSTALPTCFGESTGGIFITSVIGGTPPFEYEISQNGQNAQVSATGIFTGLGSGVYDLTVTDSLGCPAVRAIEIENPPLWEAKLTGEAEIFCGDTARLIYSVPGLASDEIEKVEWLANFNLIDTAKMAEKAVSPTSGTAYQIRVTDKNGCSHEAEQKVEVRKDINVFAPNVFSGDDDGLNDVFQVFFAQKVEKVKTFRVFDRQGNLVHQRKDWVPTALDFGWDGWYQGKKMNPGVFTWVIEYEGCFGAIETVSGDVTLVR